MKIYSLPLEARIRISRRRKERYATDADYRLRLVNRERARNGKPPLSSVDEIPSARERGSLSPLNRQRDGRGRLL